VPRALPSSSDQRYDAWCNESDTNKHGANKAVTQLCSYDSESGTGSGSQAGVNTSKIGTEGCVSSARARRAWQAKKMLARLPKYHCLMNTHTSMYGNP